MFCVRFSVAWATPCGTIYDEIWFHIPEHAVHLHLSTVVLFLFRLFATLSVPQFFFPLVFRFFPTMYYRMVTGGEMWACHDSRGCLS